MGIMRDVFGDIQKDTVKIYEPWIDQLYKLLSIEQMVIFQQSRRESEVSDKLKDRDELKGYCDSTAVQASSAVKIGDSFYTAPKPNNINGELVTPYFTQREEPETLEHTLLVPLYDSDDAAELIAAYELHSVPVIAVVKDTDAIEALQSAGIKALGYIDTDDGRANDLTQQIIAWNALPNGLFFDNVAAERDGYYEEAVQTANSYGFSTLIASGYGDYYDLFDVVLPAETDDAEPEVKGIWDAGATVTALLPEHYYVYASSGVFADMLSEIEAYYGG